MTPEEEKEIADLVKPEIEEEIKEPEIHVKTDDLTIDEIIEKSDKQMSEEFDNDGI